MAVNAVQFALANGGDPDHLADTIAAGVITPDVDGTISPRDQRILSLLMQAAKVGFTRERGYGDADIGRIAAVMHELADLEVNLHSPGGVSFEVKIACIRSLDKDFLPQAAPAVAQTAGSGRIRPRSRCFLAQGRRFSAQRTDLSSRFRSV